MKAIRLHDTDGTDALIHEDVPRPEPAADEVLVRIHAAGVNPLDWLVCRGHLPGLRDEPLPWTPGWDCSGVVERVGTDVSSVESGDAVFGMVRLPGAGGTFAEYATLGVDEVTAKPAALSHVDAAGLPMVGQTAYHALHETAGLEATQRVLVHAAAGGVGHVAVQLAANAGAHVVGTASAGNEAFLRELGVDEFVDYRRARFEDVLDPVDLVLDAVGGDVLERSAELVRPGGVVVTLPEQPPEEAVERLRRGHDATVRFFSVTDDTPPATLRRVAERVDAGRLDPTITDTYPLAEAKAALDRNADGHVRGKLVLRVREDG